jgi:two-component system, response regulator FlrC
MLIVHTNTDTQLPTICSHKAAAQAPRQAVFVDPQSQQLLALSQRVALADVTTLLTGPTGAGKEVLARVLHEASNRRSGPFVAINCGALPESLIESQLFGHERGSFTGAHKTHKGLFEQAHGGTLFLDEIGDMPLPLQVRLLRVLQERMIVRLGGEETIPVDVRLVAATHRDLRSAMQVNEFREDLYYRIATFRLRLPALAERPGDILPLALSFLQRHDAPNGAPWQLTPAAQQLLLQYPWPGNVRELENVMRRAMVLTATSTVDTAQLMFDDWLHEQPSTQPIAQPIAPTQPTMANNLHAAASAMLPPTPSQPFGQAFVANAGQTAAAVVEGDMSLNTAVRHNEWQLIQSVLANTNSRIEAAQRLGISPRTLRYKLAQLRTLETAGGMA